MRRSVTPFLISPLNYRLYFRFRLRTADRFEFPIILPTTLAGKGSSLKFWTDALWGPSQEHRGPKGKGHPFRTGPASPSLPRSETLTLRARGSPVTGKKSLSSPIGIGIAGNSFLVMSPANFSSGSSCCGFATEEFWHGSCRSKRVKQKEVKEVTRKQSAISC
jgi:hypothetical protein